MMDTRIHYLFGQYLQGACTPEEEQELALLALTDSNKEILLEVMEAYWPGTVPTTDITEEKAEEVLTTILKPATPVRRMYWKKIAVAASVLLAVALGGYLLLRPSTKPAEEIVTVTTDDIPAPSGNRAMITLPDGRSIPVDSLTSLTQNNVQLSRTSDGRIIYSGNATEVVYNTLSNPRGSKVIDMQLADGSHVWLNAGSSVTYPVAFVGNERKVAVTGEAYFEVAHDKTKPFIVSKGELNVEVLGTHFNVNAYEDESDIKVTLLEGSVRASPGPYAGGVLLKPNQQAIISGATVSLNTKVDIEQVMAWKNGRFELNGQTIEPIMRQIARWYNVDVQYNGPKPSVNFMGGTSRQENLSELLKILEQTDAVQFKVEGRKVIVSQ